MLNRLLSFAERMGHSSARAGLGVAGAVGYLGVAAGNAAVQGTMGLAAGAGMVLGGLSRVAGLGRSAVSWEQHAVGSLKYKTPQLNRFSQNAIVAAGLAGGVAAGVYGAHQQREWNLTQALSTGQLEIETPNFLGATGSLTLATHGRRRRRGQEERHGDFQTGLMRSAINGADDVAIHALRHFA